MRSKIMITDFSLDIGDKLIFGQDQRIMGVIVSPYKMTFRNPRTSEMEVCTFNHATCESREYHYRENEGMACDPNPNRISWKDAWRVEKDPRRRTIRRYHEAQQRR